MSDRASGASPNLSHYHRQLAAEKRSALLGAATRLFLAQGYSGTSLAKVAVEAGVSRSTLFKQFPTKAELFDAMVTATWSVDDGAEPPDSGDLRAGLRVLGTRYADLLCRPDMVDLYRIVIAETPRFPELSRAYFDVGKMPYYASVRDYLKTEHDAGTAAIDDADTACTHFLGMISNFVLWPRLLLVDWDPEPAAIRHTVDEAVETMVARYGRTWARP
ncbi:MULTISPECIES: TetR/AcrR family transcriptional regulator [Pseudonocardia]|uniref:HTH-type transcriptional regulator AcrR n=2 Tax=Pseudonocardia TaxID=1847 RepID=A0A1Y2MLA7_PSEAH|nr:MULTISPECIES: TetR/AcrR family transcriptional regulator [Pseudonocardia]OSY35248.1 HTH-type transcriptional regulator AcrR [Pseudonocardia autotrophica]TDN73151.1 TetR family transcriptional regulator [Pseudonocardia autotrophica]BBG03873.1 TetR family transcriptional regulator [Pseudonocardia autotrophica]GEC29534.1 TetR family transcriptional regulator [Pseudonocardia saturnea]